MNPMPAGRRLRAVLFNSTAWEGHHGCTLVCARIEELAAEAGIDIPVKLNLDPDRSPLPLDHYDLIIVNGEGTLHHDSARALRIARLGAAAQRARRPIYLVNALYEANGPEIAAGLARFDLIYARDGASAAAMAEAGLRAGTVADLSLTWDPAAGRAARRAAGHQTARAGLLVGDSVRPATSAQLYALALRRDGRFLSMRAPAPLIAGFPRRNMPRFIVDRLRQPLRYLLPPGAKRAAALSRIANFDAFIAELAAAGLVVTGRFHMFTLALALEVPVIAVASNTAKIATLCADIGLEGRAFATVAAAEEALEARGLAGFAYTREDVDRLHAFRHRALEQARAMFGAIAADARARLG